MKRIAKPVPLPRIIQVLENEARAEREARRYWRAQVFQQAADHLRKALPV